MLLHFGIKLVELLLQKLLATLRYIVCTGIHISNKITIDKYHCLASLLNYEAVKTDNRVKLALCDTTSDLSRLNAPDCLVLYDV